jgi:hypothetical protein
MAGARAGGGGVKLAKSQQSGSLYQYVKKVVGENGEIVEYPKVYKISSANILFSQRTYY